MNDYGFKAGDLLYKKRKKAGRAFRTLQANILDAAALQNLVEVHNDDVLVFIELIEDACVGDLTMTMAKVLSPHGPIYIQPTRLVSLENRDREDGLGY